MRNKILLIALSLLVLIVGICYGLNLCRKDLVETPLSVNESPDQTNITKEMIVVDFPLPSNIVTSPLTIKGRARGGWFFEGDFPVNLYAEPNGDKVESFATAKGEWMTEEFVEFEAIIEFPSTFTGDKGILELIKSNPSDMRELDDKMLIPVRFGN